jgi:hypothetical protein
MGQVGRRLPLPCATRQEHQDRLTSHLPLDVLTALAELLPLPLIVAANVAVGKTWSNLATWIIGGLAVWMIVIYTGLDIGALLISPGANQQTRYAVDAGAIVTAFAAAGFLFKPIRKDVAAFLQVDPDNPVHTLALMLFVFVLGTEITTLAFTDVLALSQAQPPLGVIDLFSDELPFLLVALAGIGLFIRRDARQAAGRLGVAVPAWWHLALALAAAGVFFVFVSWMDALSHSLTPQIAHRVDQTTQHVFGQLGGPFAIVALAVLPGICEELLFRGALQPRFGLVPTALLFTSIHTQYALSLDTLAIFVVAIGLGLIRKYTNTTASSACHTGYNLLVGIGLTGALLNAAVVVELALIVAAGYGIWASRKRPAAAQAP